METGRKTGLSRLFSPRWSTESHTGTVVVLVVMIILQTLVLGFDYDSFGHWFSAWGRNWINILRNNAAIGIIALGMTFVIITGGIDLAVGSTLVAIGAASMMMIDIGPKGFLGNLGVTGPFAYDYHHLRDPHGPYPGALTGLLITKGGSHLCGYIGYHEDCAALPSTLCRATIPESPGLLKSPTFKWAA